MSQLVRNTLGMMTGMAVLGAVFFVGSQSFAPFPATGSTAATATVAAPVGMLPANGFTDVAKAVTPAVVNITTPEGANDILRINAQGGDDVVNASTLPAGRIGLQLFGGDHGVTHAPSRRRTRK